MLTDSRRNNKEESPEAALQESGAAVLRPVPAAVQHRREGGGRAVPVPHQVRAAHAHQRHVRQQRRRETLGGDWQVSRPGFLLLCRRGDSGRWCIGKNLL